MPKQKKAVKYKKEQEEIIQKIINILEATNKTFILYDIDNNEKKQNQIYSLVNDIKKYFSSYNIGGLKEPNRYKRTWLSIVRQLLKKKYNVVSGDLTITKDKEKIRTRIYTLIDKN
jgi:dihydrodipicolinate synthase/N-acetylneuraminate lyase